mmetsp:Transcript_36775/g.103757  ORF Transcript_36775/g.103757 Transcript_36775/m.103757 type:complete len:250 (+) Transcript_36775:140-889(+)
MASADFTSLSPEDGTALKGAEKLRFVTQLFDTIAKSYDALNWFISLGQTTLWRYMALRHLDARLVPGSTILDVGCGTGWVSQYLHRKHRSLHLEIEGLDCSEGMLDIARRADPRSTYRCGDVCHMGFYKDDSFDCVLTVYTLRNFPDIGSALKEMVRVLRPGGTLLILDAFPPSSSLMRLLLRLWLGHVVPLVTRLISSDKAYQYLSHSIQNTVPAGQISAQLNALGCELPAVHLYSFGSAGCVLTRKL